MSDYLSCERCHKPILKDAEMGVRGYYHKKCMKAKETEWNKMMDEVRYGPPEKKTRKTAKKRR